MSRALIVVDAQRRVLACNPHARALLDARSSLVDDDGRVRFVDPSADAQFAQALGEMAGRNIGDGRALATAGGFVCRGRRPGDGVALVRLTPMHAAGAAASTPECALLEFRPLSQDASAPAADLERVALAWGLTRAQARVAVAIASGATPAEVAREFGVTVRTVRSHLSSVFRQLGIHGQLELARRLGAHPALATFDDAAEILAIGDPAPAAPRGGGA